MDRPNVYDQDPGDQAEGSPAHHRRAIAAGISVNVTLIFSLERYREVMDAYLAGLEQAQGRPASTCREHPLGRLVLRVPRRHRGRQAPRPPSAPTRPRRCKSKAGVANARLAYEVLRGGLRLRARQGSASSAGANAQRPLWASTGVKDPRLPDTLYVDELVAAGVVNTMPEKTLDGRPSTTATIAGDTGHRHATPTPSDVLAKLGRRSGIDLRRRHAPCSSARASTKFIVVVGRASLEYRGERRSRRAAAKRRCPASHVSRRGRRRPVRTDSSAAARRRRRVAIAGIAGAGRAALWGPAAEAEARDQRLGWIEAVADLPGAARRDRRAARRAPRRGRRPHRARRAWAARRSRREVITRTAGAELDRARHHRPGPGAPRARATGWTRTVAGRVQQVRRHRRDRQPAPGLRAGVPATPASTPARAASSSSPTRARRSTSRPREAGYRVFLADPNVGGRYSAPDRVRPGALRAGRCRRRPRCSTRPTAIRAELAVDDAATTPASCLGAALGADRARPARQARHRRRRLRTSSASATGPSS